MKFTKMQGAGNDFIVINNIEEELSTEDFSGLAKKLCQRRMALGADGLMVVEKPVEGEMCIRDRSTITCVSRSSSRCSVINCSPPLISVKLPTPPLRCPL